MPVKFDKDSKTIKKKIKIKIQKVNKMKVYCCFSLYNLYIAVAKAMVQNEKIDLVIGSQMPDYKNKIERCV